MHSRLIFIPLFLIAGAICFFSYSFYLRTISYIAGQDVERINTMASGDEHNYKLIQLGDMRRDQFLLDEKTGRVWGKTCYGEVEGVDCKGTLFWQEMDVPGINDLTLIDFVQKQIRLSQLAEQAREGASNSPHPQRPTTE
jgi:hypothetical protein